MAKRGRPSAYTAKIATQICRRLAGGESLRSICADKNLPAISTVMLWVVDGKHPEFSEQYARAREANGHSHGDRVADLAEQVLTGRLDPQAARVAMDGLKWSAERMAAKQYGKKHSLDHTSSDSSMSPQVVVYLPDNGRGR